MTVVPPPSLAELRHRLHLLPESDLIADAQAIALALVHLAAERPGWTQYLSGIAEKLGLGAYWDAFAAIEPPPKRQTYAVPPPETP